MLLCDDALNINDICKNFKKNKNEINALKNVNLRIKEGEIYGLLGPNGSGKSTLIRIASTLLIPDSGKVFIFGIDAVKEPIKVQKLISRISVEASFFKKLSPIENLLFSAGLYGISKKDAIKKIYDISEKIGLDRSRLNDSIEDFSRGMQQKVAIARAFLIEPKMMLLDEPTTGLDPNAKREVQAIILEMRKTLNTTILLTTHDMEESEKLSDYVSIIHDGQIVISGTPAELKSSVSESISNPTFEDVFFKYTGVEFEQAEKDEDEGD
jgi:ABC-2 type transport system ATP-binding protein